MTARTQKRAGVCMVTDVVKTVGRRSRFTKAACLGLVVKKESRSFIVLVPDWRTLSAKCGEDFCAICRGDHLIRLCMLSGSTSPDLAGRKSCNLTACLPNGS